MKVAQILDVKGDRVITIDPDETIPRAAQVASDIGAVVVASEDGAVAGILSERDIARRLDSHGADLMTKYVRDLMTPWVITCTPDQNVAEVVEMMNTNNIRHVPVVANGEVVGVLSIRDVIKNRLDQMARLDDPLQKLLVSLD